MSKKKILLISNLSHNLESLTELAKSQVKNITELFGSSNLPLGILSIESYVKSKCDFVETSIIDLNTEFMLKITSGDLDSKLMEIVNDFETFIFSSIEKEMDAFKPDIIGISTLFDKSVPTLLKLSELIKQKDKSVLLIAGGHPTNNLYETILKDENSFMDAICLGEGEIPFSQLVKSENPFNYVETCDWFATKLKCLRSASLSKILIENLDDIPMYDYEAFFSKYGSGILTLHNNILDSEHSFNKQAVIMTSRGCPYNCIFCASKSVHDQKMRFNSVERIKQEIDYWVDNHQVTTIGFIDDHFLFNVDRVIELCDYAGNKNLDIRFPNGLAIAPITKELVDCMVRNHVKEVQLALESGSERVLREIIRKPLSIDKAKRVFELFQDTDIFVRVFLVVGFLTETAEDIDESLIFLRSAGFHWASISTPTPISGSRLLETVLSSGQLTEYNPGQISFFNQNFENQNLAEHLNGEVRYTINLDVNFVHNPYMRMGKYHLAMERFKAILGNYPNHAFAHYYYYQCLQKLDIQSDETELARVRYNQIVQSDTTWRNYAVYFKLPLSL